MNYKKIYLMTMRPLNKKAMCSAAFVKQTIISPIMLKRLRKVIVIHGLHQLLKIEA